MTAGVGEEVVVAKAVGLAVTVELADAAGVADDVAVGPALSDPELSDPGLHAAAEANAMTTRAWDRR